MNLPATMNIRSSAEALCDDPASFFHFSHTEMQTIPRDVLTALQIEGLKYRFGALRDRIAVLKRLADNQGVTELHDLDDVVPLLFEHTIYKSYPPSLLERGKFAEINRWLSKLTTFDVTSIDVSACRFIDDWIETMDRESPLKLIHSSSTTGTMSFLPTSKKEWDKFGRTQKIDFLQTFGESSSNEDDDIWAIFPYFRYGSNAFIRINDNVVRHIVGSEERLLTAYPGRLSSDILFLAGRIRAAQARGDLDRFQIPPELIERRAAYEKLQAEMPAHMERFFHEAAEKLRGKRVFIAATWNQLHGMAKAGLARGLEHIFSHNSAILSGGGAKGMEQPEGWIDDVVRFSGASVRMAYGMSELHGVNMMCDRGHYHFAPWIVPFVLDPDTGIPHPRRGLNTGRAAFFDLSVETRWGGFITGDEITVNWEDQCACGRSTHYIEGPVQRFSDKRGGDDKISCAGTEEAHKDAMDFLTNFQ